MGNEKGMDFPAASHYNKNVILPSGTVPGGRLEIIINKV
jgi:hypothetical protein